MKNELEYGAEELCKSLGGKVELRNGKKVCVVKLEDLEELLKSSR